MLCISYPSVLHPKIKVDSDVNLYHPRFVSSFFLLLLFFFFFNGGFLWRLLNSWGKCPYIVSDLKNSLSHSLDTHIFPDHLNISTVKLAIKAQLNITTDW